jgi:hypothetical protein
LSIRGHWASWRGACGSTRQDQDFTERLGEMVDFVLDEVFGSQEGKNVGYENQASSHQATSSMVSRTGTANTTSSELFILSDLSNLMSR